MATQGHNYRAEAKALQARVLGGDRGVAFGLDLLNSKGYLGAWKEEPGKMALATGGDLILALGGYQLYKGIEEDQAPEVIHVYHTTYNTTEININSQRDTVVSDNE